MTLNEQYLLYKFATDLVKNHQFNVFYVNEKSNEVWLEKYENRSSKIVRLIHKGFDWKNYLKRDIALLFQRVLNAKRAFGKNIEVYNLYFTKHPPVDSWETLKKPLHTQGKPKMKMKVYYLDENDFPTETERFQNDLLLAPIDYDLEIPNEKKETIITTAKQNFLHSVNKKKRELTDIFNFGKPKITYSLIAINIFIFLMLEFNGGSTSIETLIQYGAKYNPAILVDGEWWRILTSMFLHIGMLHLVMNMIAIYYLGTAVEKMFGNLRFLIIYFLAGIGGSLASFAFSTSVSAGASGAVFGLFGALLYFGILYKRIFFQTMGASILFILAINLILGLLVDGIDMAAHLGGLIAGFFAAAIVNLPKKKQYKTQIIAILATITLIIGLIFYGTKANANSQSYHLLLLQDQIAEEQYIQAVDTATLALALEGEWGSAILFQRSYAYIELGEYDKALEDLEESITYANPLPQNYHNLALLYQMNGQEESAIEAIEKAYQMDPNNQDIIRLYEEITGKSTTE